MTLLRILAVSSLLLSACSPTSSPTVQPQIPTTETSGQPQQSTDATNNPKPPDIGDVFQLSIDGRSVNLLDSGGTAGRPGGSYSGASDGDTGLILTSSVTNITQLPALFIAAPAGSTTHIAFDGTAAVEGPDGLLVLGTTAPSVTDATGMDVSASWSATTGEDGASTLKLVLTDLDTDALVLPLTVLAHVGATVVATTEWGNREGGESLAVTPSAWGRVSGLTGQNYGWANLVTVEPGANTSVMEKQLRCHQIGAPDKATWNLEPWRPNVSFFEYALARCNPT